MGNPTNQQRIEVLEKEFDLLKELISTQIQTEVSAQEERMSKGQESIKEALASMITDSQNKLQETLKKCRFTNPHLH